jgi:hypothetical protein
VKCAATSVAGKRSQYVRDGRGAPGKYPCSFTASRRCPNCKAALCNGHSQGNSSMGGDMAARDRSRCAMCKHVAHDSKWLAVA